MPPSIALPSGSPGAALSRITSKSTARDAEVRESGDPRFRQLLGEQAWGSLPEAIRRRFSNRVAAGGSVVYQGEVAETRMSRLGALLVQATRILGAPFPLDRAGGGRPAIVTLTEDRPRGGQFWTRQYNRRRGFPQIVHSTKSFSGPTGLSEQVGPFWNLGVGMCLTLRVEPEALLFVGERFFLNLFGWRLALPAVLTPGQLTVGHRELGGGRFAFTLDLRHPRFGELLHQRVIFQERQGERP